MIVIKAGIFFSSANCRSETRMPIPLTRGKSWVMTPPIFSTSCLSNSISPPWINISLSNFKRLSTTGNSGKPNDVVNSDASKVVTTSCRFMPNNPFSSAVAGNVVRLNIAAAISALLLQILSFTLIFPSRFNKRGIQ